MLVSDQDVEKALNFLSETDGKFAQLKYQMESLAAKKDITEKTVFLHESGNVEERKAAARTHENTLEAHREYLRALKEYETLKNERDTAHVTVWCWRSLKASERTTV